MAQYHTYYSPFTVDRGIRSLDGYFPDAGKNPYSVFCYSNISSTTSPSGNPSPRTPLAILFQGTGKISRNDCFFTTRGDIDFFGDDDEVLAEQNQVASCWIEAPEDINGRETWGTLMKRVKDIAESGDAIKSMLLRYPTACRQEERKLDKFQLQVSSPLRSTNYVLPLIDKEGNRHSPQSLDEVPFDKKVRITFMLQQSGWSMTIGERERKLLGADLISMRVL